MDGAQTTKRQISERFGAKVTTYDDFACVQREMMHHLMALLHAKHRTPVQHVLEIGCGTGALTDCLLTTYAQAQVTAVDIALPMIEATARRCASDVKRVRLLHGDGERLEDVFTAPPPPRFDLIVSSAAIQWFTAPCEAMKNWVRYLQPHGTIAFATFGPRTLEQLRQAFILAEAQLGLPHVPRTLAFVDPLAVETQLCQLGADVTVQEQIQIVTYATPRELLHHMKAIGANHVPRYAQTKFHRALFLRMDEAYTHTFGNATGVPATYQVVYAVATFR